MKIKSAIAAVLCAAICMVSLFACTAKENGTINVISREKGSGTRTAFIELFGVEEKDADGNKVDKTTDKAETTDKTGTVLVTVAGSKNSIGYISLGSMNDTVKALKIDGVAPSIATVKDGSYAAQRPFNIVTKEGLSASAQDFIDFILSSDGQKVVTDSGYIAIEGLAAFSGTGSTEKVIVNGSSSVTPLMEKLQEAYKKLYPSSNIQINMSDSGTGVKNAIEGTCDIGMASRKVTDKEKGDGAIETKIADDGIVVVVNKNRAIDNLTKAQVKDIFTGKTTTWSEVEK
jgi:phosphate transport system substrate-binding protein